MLRDVRWFVIFATVLMVGSLVMALLAGTTVALQLLAIYAAVVAVFLLLAEVLVRLK
jgi:hypothetical protein